MVNSSAEEMKADVLNGDYELDQSLKRVRDFLSGQLCIDARYFGNVARFIKHRSREAKSKSKRKPAASTTTSITTSITTSASSVGTYTAATTAASATSSASFVASASSNNSINSFQAAAITTTVTMTAASLSSNSLSLGARQHSFIEKEGRSLQQSLSQPPPPTVPAPTPAIYDQNNMPDQMLIRRRIFSNAADMRYPKLALFAAKRIPENSELLL
jgi:hypothetical protein